MNKCVKYCIIIYKNAKLCKMNQIMQKNAKLSKIIQNNA
jgi:hypothetical protein